MDKVNEVRATDYITAYYKEINEEILHLARHKNFAGILQAVVNFLKELLKNGQIHQVCERIKVMGWLYRYGDEYVQFILENLFVRSFEGLRKRCTVVQWKEIYKQIPLTMKKIYVKQMNPF